VLVPPSSSAPVVLAGKGPSAWALAQALVERRHRPLLVAPNEPARVPPTLCAFVDELPTAVLRSAAGDVFSRTVVHTGAGLLDLQRPYVRLDFRAFQAALSGAVDERAARIVSVKADGRGVTLDDGTNLSARYVVDATGHAPALVRRGVRTRRNVEQAAFGLWVDGTDDELSPGTALFMDWRSPYGDSDVDDGGPPSFLYALSFRDGRLLLEETSLASSPAVSFDVLERRLRARLKRRGTRITRERGIERVLFPMVGALPLPAQPTAAFGAALGLVQPVTGYSVARSFRAAGLVAGLLSEALAQQVEPTTAADKILAAVWTPEARARRRLQLFGLDALCAFDANAARAFFTAFFAQPAPVWRDFLSGALPAEEQRRAMWRLFSAVPSSVRWQLLRGATSPVAPAVLADAVLCSKETAAPAPAFESSTTGVSP
jgi:lycopene beta-cyclase